MSIGHNQALALLCCFSSLSLVDKALWRNCMQKLLLHLDSLCFIRSDVQPKLKSCLIFVSGHPESRFLLLFCICAAVRVAVVASAHTPNRSFQQFSLIESQQQSHPIIVISLTGKSVVLVRGCARARAHIRRLYGERCNVTHRTTSPEQEAGCVFEEEVLPV